MPVEFNDEIALVRQAQSGSTEPFGILVNRYERRIYRLVRAVTRNNEDAEDAFRKAFLKAYADIHYFNGESRFYTWMVRVAMNKTLSKLRHRQVHAWVSFDEPASPGEDMSSPGEIRDWHHNLEESYSQPELSAILSKALEDLETPLRTAFALHDIEGFSDEETASVLGLPLAAVTARLMRARLKLRQSLSDWFEDLSVPVVEQGGCASLRNFLGAALAKDRECT